MGSDAVERRFYCADDVAVVARSAEGQDDDAEMKLEGYAAVFDSETVISGLFREKIARGAFTKTIKEGDVFAFWNHDDNIVLGRTGAGTLKLSTDERGLRYEVSLSPAPDAQNVWHAVKRGDVTHSSFGFIPVKQTIEEPRNEGELPLRILKEVKLIDVSPVTRAAYNTTSVSARSAEQAVYEGIMAEIASRGATSQEPPTEPPAGALQGTQEAEPQGRSIWVAKLDIMARTDTCLEAPHDN